MNNDGFEEPDGSEASAHLLPQGEATLLSVWRRVLEEGGSPQLTLAEAATLLGSSVGSVRRRIRAGQIRAFKDSKGRIRINASVTYAPEVEPLLEDAAATSETVSRLWYELKEVRDELVDARSTNRRLRDELEATEAALEYTKGEVANLWAVMTSRNQSRQAEPSGPPSRLSVERQRIQGKISNMRDIARRRRFPWSMAG